MELSIIKFTGKDHKQEKSYYPIQKYKAIPFSQSLLIVSDGEMDNEGKKMKFYEIFKVQAVASCTISLSENALLVAFYLGESGELYPCVLSGLPNSYYHDGERFFLIDYKSYCEICDYTGEAKLSISDYIKEVKSGFIGSNALLDNDGELLNYDQQKKYYKDNPIEA